MTNYIIAAAVVAAVGAPVALLPSPLAGLYYVASLALWSVVALVWAARNR